MNIFSIEKDISPLKLKAADKVKLREIEEEKTNQFVAFADEGEMSFDIGIEIDAKGNVVNNNCDCGNSGWCSHEIALLKNISALKSKTPKKRKTREKILRPTEVLMNTLADQEVRAWLLQYLDKNKEAQLAFNLEFGTQKKEYSVAEVEKLLVDTIQSVIGKRKSASAAENKKIVELLNKSFEPVVEFLKLQVQTKLPYEVFVATAYKLVFYSNQLYDSSTRYKKFIKEFMDKLVLQFNQTKDLAVWQKIALAYWDSFINESKLYFFNRDFVFSTFLYANDEQKNIIAEHCIGYIKKWIKDKTSFSTDFNIIMLRIVVDTGRFSEVQDFFKPSKYENEYNVVIIKELVKIDPYTALGYCHSIIQSNYYESYNEPYYEIIELILKTIPEDKNEIARYKLLKIERGFRNFEDYDYIKENLQNETVFKEFHKKILTQLGFNFFRRQKEGDLLFKLLLEAKNYKGVFEVVNIYTPAESILPLLETLHQINKDKLIINLKRRLSNLQKSIKDHAAEKELLEWMINAYDKSYFVDLKGYTMFSSNVNYSVFIDQLHSK